MCEFLSVSLFLVMLQTEKRSCFPLIKLGNFYPLFITSLILCLPWSCLCWLHLLMWDEKGRKGKTWTTSIFLFILYICEQFFFSSLLPPSWGSKRHVLEWEEHASKTRLETRFVFMFFLVIQGPSSSHVHPHHSTAIDQDKIYLPIRLQNCSFLSRLSSPSWEGK